eukprot:4219707-Pleurochrysis_carterae.AAC.1
MVRARAGVYARFGRGMEAFTHSKLDVSASPSISGWMGAATASGSGVSDSKSGEDSAAAEYHLCRF